VEKERKGKGRVWGSKSTLSHGDKVQKERYLTSATPDRPSHANGTRSSFICLVLFLSCAPSPPVLVSSLSNLVHVLECGHVGPHALGSIEERIEAGPLLVVWTHTDKQGADNWTRMDQDQK
jgi:hypothetical protein